MSNLNTQLKTLLQVARLGSFRQAADELFVTQAAVTSRIKALEEWLGFSVFLRHRRGADLTPQGERFIEYARNAIDIIEHGREEARRTKSYRAHYRYMSQFLLLNSFSLDWVDWMKIQAPDVSLTIDSNYSMIAAKEISSGLLDLAVGYQYKILSGVVFETLFTEKLILVTSFETTEQWRDNYIPIGWDKEFDDEQRRFIGELEDSYRIRALFIDTARALLLREPCSAYILERIALPMIQQGLVMAVPKAPTFERPAYAIYPSNPIHPDVQAIALEGLRAIADKLNPK
jgi:DNA-binding transcriptional LysR family regulator